MNYQNVNKRMNFFFKCIIFVWWLNMGLFVNVTVRKIIVRVWIL